MKEVQKFIEEHNMVCKNDKIIIGVSGGADSLCLLFELLEFCTAHGNAMEVVHVEHGIRGKDSLEDAAFVETLCGNLKIPFHLYRYPVREIARERRLTEEEAGRSVRYEAFADACARFGGTKIAVAHHLDDQAETILFHLVRGSGLKGLCGMEPVRDKIIRPLLRTRRQEIEESLKERQITWRVDATNEETDYARNKIRLELMPMLKENLNERAAEHIAAAGDKLQKIEKFLKKQTEKLEEQLCIQHTDAWGNPEILIDRKSLAEQEELLQEQLLCLCIGKMPQGQKDIGEVHIRALQKLLCGENGKRLDLPGRIAAQNRNQYLALYSVNEKKKTEEALFVKETGEFLWNGLRIMIEKEVYEIQEIPQKKYTKWFDYDTIKDTIELRFRRPGDYLYINEVGGRKTLKKYLIDEKIPQNERDRVPVLADGSHILWVIGHRISNACKVTDNTKKILKIQIEKEKENGRQDKGIVK